MSDFKSLWVVANACIRAGMWDTFEKIKNEMTRLYAENYNKILA